MFLLFSLSLPKLPTLPNKSSSYFHRFLNGPLNLITRASVGDYLSKGNLPLALPWRRKIVFSSETHWLLWLLKEMCSWMSPSPIHGGMSMCIILCESCVGGHCCWVHKCHSHRVMSGHPFLFLYPCTFPPLLPWCSLGLGMGNTDVLSRIKHFNIHLISILWPITNLYSNWHPHKKKLLWHG